MRESYGLAGRLKHVRSALAYTQAKIAEAVGSKQRSWQDYETGKKVPGSQVIAGLVRLGFNANWILTGHGPPRLDELAGHGELLGDRLYARIPNAPGEVRDGDALTAYSPSGVVTVAFSRAWLDSIGVQPHEVVQLIMPDDSMTPTVPPGAYVAADGARGTVDVPGIWAIEAFDKRTAVRIRPDAGDGLLITYDNPLYKEWRVKHDQITILGKVIWYGGPAP